MLVKVTMYNIRNVAIRWQIHDFLSNGSSMFALYYIVCEIFAKNKKNAKTLTLLMKVKAKRLRNGTCAIRLDMFESIQVIF